MHRIEKTPNEAGTFIETPPNRTPIGADWLNAIQEELAYVIEQASITLKYAATDTHTQLLEAINTHVLSPFDATAQEIDNACDLTVNGFHASGRAIYLYENVAPTGWTIVAVPDAVLATKGGAQAYNVNGGNLAGSWTQPDHTLIVAEMPAHTHSHIIGDSAAGITSVVGQNNAGNLDTSSTGGDGAHNHGIIYRPYAAVGIVASRDA